MTLKILLQICQTREASTPAAQWASVLIREQGATENNPIYNSTPPQKKTKLGDKMNLGSDKVHTENQKTLQDEDSNRRDCSTLNTTYLTQSPWKSQQFFLEAGK